MRWLSFKLCEGWNTSGGGGIKKKKAAPGSSRRPWNSLLPSIIKDKKDSGDKSTCGTFSGGVFLTKRPVVWLGETVCLLKGILSHWQVQDRQWVIIEALGTNAAVFFLDPIELSMLAFVFLTNVARWRFHCAADLPTSSMKKFSVQVFHDQTEALNCEEESGKQLLQAK